MEKESVPTLKKHTMQWAQGRPGYKHNIRKSLTDGITGEIFEMGLEGC